MRETAQGLLDEARRLRDAAELDAALTQASEAAVIAREHRLHDLLAHALLLSAVCRLRRGDVGGIDPLLDEGQLASRLAELPDLESDILAVRGLVQRHRGKWLLAARAYTEALRLRPGHLGLINNIATIEALLGDHASALRHFLQVAEDPEMAATGWLNVARCRERLGQSREAMEALQEAEAGLLEKDPRRTWAIQIRAALVRGEEGVALLQALPDSDANVQQSAAVLQAALLRELGRPEEALEVLSPFAGDEVLSERASCLACLGRFEEAWTLVGEQNRRLQRDRNEERASVLGQLEAHAAGHQAELLAAVRRAEEGNRVRTRFLASVNHELRTPVTAVLGALELLSRTTMAADQTELVSIGRDAASLLRDLLGGVLDLTQLESGGVSLRNEPFSPREAAEMVVRMMRPRLRPSVTLSLTCRGLPARVRGDMTRFRQVLLNLTDNAVKFTREGTIHVQLRWRRGLVVRVADSGPGLDGVVLLEPFARAGSAAGSGLGLAIVRGLVAAWGGELRWTSSAAGTVFEFDAPFPAVGAAGPSPDGRILVVDDQSINRLVLSKQLERQGFGVTLADAGEAALALTEGVDLVLLDVHMPQMSGWETARRLRDQGFGGPILALTADLLPETEVRCMQAGMDEVLGKPLTSDELGEAVSRWLT